MEKNCKHGILGTGCALCFNDDGTPVAPSPTWKEKEREAFYKRFPNSGEQPHADYWLSRMEAACTKSNDAVFNFQSGYEKGRFQELSRIVGIVEELAGDPPLESNERRRGFQEFATQLLAKITKE